VFDRHGQQRDPAAIHNRIVGGTPAPPGAFPFHAKSSLLNDGFCGASLIWEDILLTAAHCNGTFWEGAAIGGTQSDDSDATVIPVDFELLHPEYDGFTFENGTHLYLARDLCMSFFFLFCSQTFSHHSHRHHAGQVNLPK
jgi:hypothetical protein